MTTRGCRSACAPEQTPAGTGNPDFSFSPQDMVQGHVRMFYELNQQEEMQL